MGGELHFWGNLINPRLFHYNRVDRDCISELNLSKFFRIRKRIMVSAILLGAGESKRMGMNKLFLPWGRKTVLGHCVGTLLRSRIKELIVVLSDLSEEIKGQIEKESALARKKVRVTMNPNYKRGMSTSIRKGIQVMDPRSQGILIALGDQPLVKTRTINALIDAFCERKEAIVVPSFHGEKGHPVIFHRRYKKELLTLKGDMGGRSIFQKYPKSIEMVPVRSEGVIKDIDTWQEYNPPTSSLPHRRLCRSRDGGWISKEQAVRLLSFRMRSFKRMGNRPR
jgi:molybdenum cofactor cytidylyltransferase